MKLVIEQRIPDLTYLHTVFAESLQRGCQTMQQLFIDCSSFLHPTRRSRQWHQFRHQQERFCFRGC